MTSGLTHTALHSLPLNDLVEGTQADESVDEPGQVARAPEDAADEIIAEKPHEAPIDASDD